VLIRPATADDWPAIWPFLRVVVAAGETYALPRDLPEPEARAYWMPGPPHAVFVAVDGGRVLGSAKAGPNQRGPGDHVGTASFVVDPAVGRRGVGRALGEHVVGWAAAQGFRCLQFNAVVSTNTRAVALWESLGFTENGRVPGGFRHPVHGYVDLLLMHRSLTAAAPEAATTTARR
jgi:GNAT superfamily N-acetyltransferase